MEFWKEVRRQVLPDQLVLRAARKGKQQRVEQAAHDGRIPANQVRRNVVQWFWYTAGPGISPAIDVVCHSRRWQLRPARAPFGTRTDSSSESPQLVRPYVARSRLLLTAGWNLLLCALVNSSARLSC